MPVADNRPTWLVIAVRILVTTIVVLLGTELAARKILAASPGEAGGVGSGSSMAAIRCERSFVYSKRLQGCARVNSGLVEDKELHEQGRALALAGHYRNALDALEAISGPKDAMMLTMIGYAERKLGNLDRSLKAYGEALDLDPGNADAREYLGEAYIDMGQIDRAKLQLQALEQICGRTCEQYHDLAEAIAAERVR